MWTCPQCGEMHESQFDSCWKCAGEAMPEKPGAPAKLDTLDPPVALWNSSFFVGRGIQAFILASILGIAYGLIAGATAEEAVQNGLIFGVVAGIVIGVLWWVLFPYKRNEAPPAEES